jgi:protein-S-isoprenylcysteine O-methyltransferase
MNFLLTHSWALALGIASVFASIILEAWLKLRDRKKIDPSKDENSLTILGNLVISSLLLSLFSSWKFESLAANAFSIQLFWIGVTLIWVGVLFRLWAVLTLGNYFRRVVMVHADHPVIEHGPFRLIRHPSYTGLYLTLIGFGFMLGNWASIVLMTIGPFMGFLTRMQVEEQVLKTELGEKYAAYMQRTKRLIPWVY